MNGLNLWLSSKTFVLGVIGGIATFALLVVNSLKDGFQTSDITIIVAGLSALLAVFGLKNENNKLLQATDIAKK